MLSKTVGAALLGGTPIESNPIENTYADIATMLSSQSSQTLDYFQYVVDASADPGTLSVAMKVKASINRLSGALALW